MHFGVDIRTSSSFAVETELAFNGRVDIQTFLAQFAFGELFASFSGMHKVALVLVLAVGPESTSLHYFLAIFWLIFTDFSRLLHLLLYSVLFPSGVAGQSLRLLQSINDALLSLFLLSLLLAFIWFIVLRLVGFGCLVGCILNHSCCSLLSFILGLLLRVLLLRLTSLLLLLFLLEFLLFK